MLKRICTTAAAAALLAVSFDSNALIVETGGGGSGPDCNGAAASLGVIWPPDRQMVAETIVGVTDPDGLPISITITGIQQDQPVRGGDDNAQPDGSGVGTSTAYVRAARGGWGSGRLYFISFTATNSQGAQCTGTVEAFVPHHQGLTPVDTGRRYDSTVATTGDDRDDGRDGGRGRDRHDD